MKRVEALRLSAEIKYVEGCAVLEPSIGSLAVVMIPCDTAWLSRMACLNELEVTLQH